MKPTKLLLLSTLVTLAPSCKHVTVPDITECQVAGMLIAGADCSATGHEENTELDFAGLKKLLEDGAIIIPLADRTKEKTALQQLCYAAGDNCTYEMKQQIAKMAEVKKRAK